MLLDTDEEDDVVVTGALPSGICNGFIPGVQDFHTNFPFQLLPSLAHIVLSGATFHHISYSANNFKLVPSDSSTTKPNVNEQCRLLESDDKLSNILERSRLSLAQNNVLKSWYV